MVVGFLVLIAFTLVQSCINSIVIFGAAKRSLDNKKEEVS